MGKRVITLENVPDHTRYCFASFVGDIRKDIAVISDPRTGVCWIEVAPRNHTFTYSHADLKEAIDKYNSL